MVVGNETLKVVDQSTLDQRGPEIVELLRRCTVAAENMVHAFEDQYAISNDLRRTIATANKLLKELEQDKAIQED
jgi:broad specificity phosphatase PhoE